MSLSAIEQAAIVITGASTGIGEACALALDARGHRVFAGVCNDADGRRLRGRATARLTPLHLDVTDAASIRAAADQVAAAVGNEGLAGLVNNAGIVVAGPLEILPLGELRRQLEVNVIGPIAVTQAMLPLLRLARGRIVNMSSISGRMAAPYMGPYAASKYALEAFSDALRVELRSWGIAVVLIEPGSIATPIWEKSLAAADQIAAGVNAESLALYEADMDALREATRRMAAGAAPVEKVVRAVIHAFRPGGPRRVTPSRWKRTWPSASASGRRTGFGTGS